MIYTVRQDCSDCAPCEQNCCCPDIGFGIVITRALFTLDPATVCNSIHEIKPAWGDPPACLLSLADGRDMTYRIITTSSLGAMATQDFANVTAAQIGTPFTRLELMGPDGVDRCDNCIVRVELSVLCDDEEIAKCVLCPGPEACDEEQEVPPCSEAEELSLVFSGMTLCPDCVNDGAASFKYTAFTLSAETVTGGGPWSTFGGSFDYDLYSTPDCTGPPGSFDRSEQITVTCSDGIYTVVVGFPYEIFRGTGILGEAIENTISCWGGTVTVEEV